MQKSVLEQVGFYCALLLCISSQISVAIGSIACGIGFIMLMLTPQARRRVFENDVRPILFGMLVFLFFITISNFFSTDWFGNQNRLLAVATRWLPLFLILGFVTTTKQWKCLVGALLLSMFIADCVGIYQHFNYSGGGHDGARAIGFEKNPIYYAAEILVIAMLALVFSLRTAKTTTVFRMISIILFVISCIAIFMSGTRGAWIALLVGIVFSLYFWRDQLTRKARLGITTVFLGGAILYCLLVPEFLMRLLSIVNFQDQSNIERIYLWQSSWNMFLDHPFAGVGMGQFNTFYTEKYILPAAREPGLAHPHNSFLTFLCENGILGVVAFLSLFISVLYVGYQKALRFSWGRILFLQTLVFFVGAMTDNLFTVLILMRLYWVSIGMAIVAFRLGI